MSASVNRILLLGKLDTDPEIRCLPSGDPVATLMLTTSHRHHRSDGSGVDHLEWHRIRVSGKLADFARDRLRKGHEVYVEGRIRTEALIDDAGTPRKTTVIVAHLLRDLSKVGSARDGMPDEVDDMSWLDTPPPIRPSVDDDDIPF